MEPQLFGLIVVLACACAVSAVPASGRREDLTHLVSLLGKLKDIERVRQSSGSDTAPAFSSLGSDANDDDDISNDGDEAASLLQEQALEKGFLGTPSRRGGVNKRQGAWSYDYGLGGGRFGKRSYGDYGIGGGRFGRDVDHVDPSDNSDPDMTSS